MGIIKIGLSMTIGLSYLLASPFGALRAEEGADSKDLADAFQSDHSNQKAVEEVEPVVVGRKKWDESPEGKIRNEGNESLLPASPRIAELDPLETKQANLGRNGLPLLPPKIMPAVHLHRNFEGILVLKPRKLGFETKFPYHLENSLGRRLAYVDASELHAVNPLSYEGKKVNLLGRLEPVEEGSKEMVIRAKVIRLVE